MTIEILNYDLAHSYFKESGTLAMELFYDSICMILKNGEQCLLFEEENMPKKLLYMLIHEKKYKREVYLTKGLSYSSLRHHSEIGWILTLLSDAGGDILLNYMPEENAWIDLKYKPDYIRFKRSKKRWTGSINYLAKKE